jgi:hypothetical protein
MQMSDEKKQAFLLDRAAALAAEVVFQLGRVVALGGGEKAYDLQSTAKSLETEVREALRKLEKQDE